MLNILKNNNSRKIVNDGYSLLMVAHVNELKHEQLEYLDGFVIDSENRSHVQEIIVRIRTHKNLKICLLPIFINNLYKQPKELVLHTDGYINLELESNYFERVITIANRIKNIETPKTIYVNSLIQHKTIAYLYTRNAILKPIADRKSTIGYTFPFISLYYKHYESIVLLKNLEEMRTLHYVTFQLKDYIHLCKSCDGNYLNFREACPKCSGIDIVAHDMIHHFVCAHVAPEKDFKIEDGLACPKCDKNLRHIGIDYDKPSTIYSCNCCNHEFQNANMKALCLDCETENQLEELLEKSIGEYSITQKGENILFDASIKNQIQENQSMKIGSMPPQLFKIVLNQEIKRIKATNGYSYFAKIEFRNQQLQLLNDNVKSALTKEISGIIKSYMEGPDILSAENFNCYYLMLPDTREDQLQRLELIDYNLAKLINDNTTGDNQKVEIKIHRIDKNDTLQTFFS
ncbi:TackOD1 domain-containing metal-binding protein [Flavicella marina]|uniref:TackOD1 domain-containing metal-binding protein n=1 Tax=Flavicella marina TaxID=1475951 RepID=UPI001264E4A3|nr:hypothetical protein [Flavicella marina]